MSDLISRKELLKKLEGKNSYSLNTATTEEIMKSYAFAEVICLIEHQPTAFDVEKVVEQLKQLQEDGIPTRSAINIVKRGGKDE